jgi:hypothetical protein
VINRESNGVLCRGEWCLLGPRTWHDIGMVAIGFRMLLKLFDYGFFATLISHFAHHMSDYKKNV